MPGLWDPRADERQHRAVSTSRRGEPVLLELPDYIVVPASVCPLITSPLVRAPLVRIAKNAVSAIEDGYMQELDKHDRKRASIAVIALLRLLEGYAEEDETA